MHNSAKSMMLEKYRWCGFGHSWFESSAKKKWNLLYISNGIFTHCMILFLFYIYRPLDPSLPHVNCDTCSDVLYSPRPVPAGTGLARPWDPLKRKVFLPVQMRPMEKRKFLHHGKEEKPNSRTKTCPWHLVIS